jgi:hypothetical protein
MSSKKPGSSQGSNSEKPLDKDPDDMSFFELLIEAGYSRKLLKTVYFITAVIAFTLLLKVGPFSSWIVNDVFYTWQFFIIFMLGCVIFWWKVWMTDVASDRTSFVAMDERKRAEKAINAGAKADLFADDIIRRAVQNAKSSVSITNKLGGSRKAVSGYSFVEHMKSIIESLDYQIDYAEEKASTLLEVGRGFVRGGIILYVVSIVVWQAYLYYIDFSMNVGLVVGMVSTTVIFVIMEFLGAWYLKQYRHYGDSAFSYMKVRSSYNKYMLAYCAVVEFSADQDSKSKDDVLRVLSESENWPDMKDVNSNDFNYMIQSVESMSTIFEKLKGVFSRTSVNGTQE